MQRIRSSLILLAGGLLGTAGWAGPVAPAAVSPGEEEIASRVADGCPTFSWSAVGETSGYELVVYRMTGENLAVELAPGAPVLHQRLPAGVSTWTPALERCLEPGQQYAWSVRADGIDSTSNWSSVRMFEVAVTPSLGEVEAAMATLRRYLSDRQRKGAEAGVELVLPPGFSSVDRPRAVTAASVPVLGIPSLTLDANVALGAESNLFKDGSVFLWDEGSNLGLGREALAAASGMMVANTALGRSALRSTIGGSESIQGNHNTAVGTAALSDNTTGRLNTAIGANTLRLNETGEDNTAIGAYALNETTGNNNTAVGSFAGLSATTGSDNIYLGGGAVGAAGEANTIRIGGSTGSGPHSQNRTFVAGIEGITTGVADAVTVLVDSNGQLGTASSSRAVKQDVREIGERSRRLLDLQPVAFRYRQHVASDPHGPVQYGLIAEEVAEVLPELVVYDEDGEPRTVKYRLLSTLLLNELKEQNEDMVTLRERVTTLELGSRPPMAKHPWWRRVLALEGGSR